MIRPSAGMLAVLGELCKRVLETTVGFNECLRGNKSDVDDLRHFKKTAPSFLLYPRESTILAVCFIRHGCSSWSRLFAVFLMIGYRVRSSRRNAADLVVAPPLRHARVGMAGGLTAGTIAVESPQPHCQPSFHDGSAGWSDGKWTTRRSLQVQGIEPCRMNSHATTQARKAIHRHSAAATAQPQAAVEGWRTINGRGRKSRVQLEIPGREHACRIDEYDAVSYTPR